ncbi:unnamed protein product [Sphagnum jensenii]|uniref:Guanylate cyclase domain-containing protein n=1 Tax=Sphagnum jensenii TaxID=128206 RepID=A0ABP0VDN2_9BRYO
MEIVGRPPEPDTDRLLKLPDAAYQKRPFRWGSLILADMALIGAEVYRNGGLDKEMDIAFGYIMMWLLVNIVTVRLIVNDHRLRGGVLACENIEWAACGAGGEGGDLSREVAGWLLHECYRNPPASMHEKISEIKRLIPVDIRLAREATELLLGLVEAGGSDKDRAEVYHLAGLVRFYADEVRDAVKWYNKELKLRQKLKDTKGASDALNNIGATYYQKGQLDKAMNYYKKALAHREKINDRRGIAGCYENIGVVMLRFGMVAGALDMHFQALKINQELGETERVGVSLQNIGMAYYSQGDYDYALEKYKESLDIAQKINDKVRAIQLMINIGSVLIRKNDFAGARKYYKRCYEESRTIGYQHGLIASLHNLADIELNKGNYQESIKHYMESIHIARGTGHILHIISAMTGMGRSYGLLGRYRKALEYYKQYISLRDDMINKETSRTITEIKTRYEVEKKEKEAEISRLRNTELKSALDALTAAKEQSDELLLNILPRDVAEELKDKGSVTARYYEHAAVLFIDVKDFTSLSEHLSPHELVSVIDVYFSLFDSIIGEYAIEKIKTIGDAYLCVAGLPVPDEQSAVTAVRAAIQIRDTVSRLNKMRRDNDLLCFEFRFGLHVGPVIAGVVGQRKFEYDIWGDTVNTAARMEQLSDAGHINITGETHQLLRDAFECSYRGKIEAKNKGLLDMYFVEREKADKNL